MWGHPDQDEGPRAFAEDPLGTAAGPLTRFARWGKASGCRVDFVRPVTAIGLQEGPLEIVSSATVYRGEAGARAAFAYAARSLVPAAYVSLPVDFPLADRSREWVRQGTSSFGTMLVYLLLWHDRNVNASILIVGRVGVVSAASLAPVARPLTWTSKAIMPQPCRCAFAISPAKSSSERDSRSSLATTSALASPASKTAAVLIPGRRRSFADQPASSTTSIGSQRCRSHSAAIARRCASSPAPLTACSSVETRTLADAYTEPAADVRSYVKSVKAAPVGAQRREAGSTTRTRPFTRLGSRPSDHQDGSAEPARHPVGAAGRPAGECSRRSRLPNSCAETGVTTP